MPEKPAVPPPPKKRAPQLTGSHVAKDPNNNTSINLPPVNCANSQDCTLPNNPPRKRALCTEDQLVCTETAALAIMPGENNQSSEAMDAAAAYASSENTQHRRTKRMATCSGSNTEPHISSHTDPHFRTLPVSAFSQESQDSNCHIPESYNWGYFSHEYRFPGKADRDRRSMARTRGSSKKWYPFSEVGSTEVPPPDPEDTIYPETVKLFIPSEINEKDQVEEYLVIETSLEKAVGASRMRDEVKKAMMLLSLDGWRRERLSKFVQHWFFV